MAAPLLTVAVQSPRSGVIKRHYAATCTLLYADPSISGETPFLGILSNLPANVHIGCQCHPDTFAEEIMHSVQTALPVFGGALLQPDPRRSASLLGRQRTGMNAPNLLAPGQAPEAGSEEGDTYAFHGNGRPLLYTLVNHPHQSPNPEFFPSPEGRSGHVFAPVEDFIVLHAGLGQQHFNDTWIFYPDTLRWRHLTPGLMPSPPSSSSVACGEAAPGRAPQQQRIDVPPNSSSHHPDSPIDSVGSGSPSIYLPPKGYGQAFAVFHPLDCVHCDTASWSASVAGGGGEVCGARVSATDTTEPARRVFRHQHLFTFGGCGDPNVLNSSSVFCGRQESWAPVHFTTTLPPVWGAAAETLLQPRQLARHRGARGSVQSPSKPCTPSGKSRSRPLTSRTATTRGRETAEPHPPSPSSNSSRNAVRKPAESETDVADRDDEEEVVVMFGGMRQGEQVVEDMFLFHMERPLTAEDVEQHPELILSGLSYYRPDAEQTVEVPQNRRQQMLVEAVGKYLVEVLPASAFRSGASSAWRSSGAPVSEGEDATADVEGGAASNVLHSLRLAGHPPYYSSVGSFLSCPCPAPRRRPCSALYDKHRMVIFGGRDAHRFYNDIWEFNSVTRTWTDLYPVPPQAREPFATFFPANSVPRGGRGGSSATDVVNRNNNNAQSQNSENSTTAPAEPQPSPGFLPPPVAPTFFPLTTTWPPASINSNINTRRSSSSNDHSQSAITSRSGSPAGEPGTLPEATRPAPPPPADPLHVPLPRTGACMAMDCEAGVAIVFGGLREDQSYVLNVLNDMWVFHMERHEWELVKFNEAHPWDPERDFYRRRLCSQGEMHRSVLSRLMARQGYTSSLCPNVSHCVGGDDSEEEKTLVLPTGREVSAPMTLDDYIEAQRQACEEEQNGEAVPSVEGTILDHLTPIDVRRNIPARRRLPRAPVLTPSHRTMAAIAQDPLNPGKRFFLHGGRFISDPRADLFEITLDQPEPLQVEYQNLVREQHQCYLQHLVAEAGATNGSTPSSLTNPGFGSPIAEPSAHRSLPLPTGTNRSRQGGGGDSSRHNSGWRQPPPPAHEDPSEALWIAVQSQLRLAYLEQRTRAQCRFFQEVSCSRRGLRHAAQSFLEAARVTSEGSDGEAERRKQQLTQTIST